MTYINTTETMQPTTEGITDMTTEQYAATAITVCDTETQFAKQNEEIDMTDEINVSGTGVEQNHEFETEQPAGEVSVLALALTWGARFVTERPSRKTATKSKKPKKSASRARMVEDATAQAANEPVSTIAETAVCTTSASTTDEAAGQDKVETTAIEIELEPVTVEESSPSDLDASVKPVSKTDFIAAIQIGDERKGTVSFVAPYGAFIKVGPASGLLHVSCMPGSTNEEKQAFLRTVTYNQPIDVTVVSKHPIKGLGFSLIASEKANYIRSLRTGQIVPGTVIGVKEGVGARVNLEGKTIGFLHVTQLAGATRDERDAALAAMTGKLLDLVVINIDLEKQEVRLSQRLLGLASFVVGSRVSGEIVRNQKDVVVFKLEGGVKGLLHKSRFSGQEGEAEQLEQIGGTADSIVESIELNEQYVVLTRKTAA